jgi:hypothetical protein
MKSKKKQGYAPVSLVAELVAVAPVVVVAVPQLQY